MANLVGLLQIGQGHGGEMQGAVLDCLLALAVDDANRQVADS